MSETQIPIHSFSSAKQLAENLADTIADSLKKAITLKGHSTLVVSGGTTPRPLFERLAQKTIPWKQISLTLADERWVDTSDASSNERLVRTLLLKEKASQARFIGLKNDAITAEDGEQETHDRLSTIPRPFDIIILGMGDDGHTASLFPGSEQLTKAVDMQSTKLCIALSPPQSPYQRISLTLPALLDSKEIILHISGENKMKVLKTALEEGPPEVMPIRYLLKQRITPVRIFWAP